MSKDKVGAVSKDEDSSPVDRVKRWQEMARLYEQNNTAAPATQVQPAQRDRAALPAEARAQVGASDGFGRRRPTLDEHSGLRPSFRPDPELAPRPSAAPAPAAGATTRAHFSDATHPEFHSRDGYPQYRQGDPAWGHHPLGSSTMGAKGCAVTAVASAVSGISGQTVTPGQMDQNLRAHHGYSGAAISNWGQMGNTVHPPVAVHREHGVNADRVDRELAAGRPVVMGVDYKAGGAGNRHAGHDGQTDHWITVTGRNADGTYRANDPATGQGITMHRTANGHLQADHPAHNGSTYISTGDAATFSRGPAHPTTGESGPRASAPGGTTPPRASAPGGTTPPRASAPGATGPEARHPTHARPPGQTAPVTGATPPGAVQHNGFRSIDPAQFRNGGTSSLAATVIGTSEGTRTAQGGHTRAFGGHTDPGNRAHNIGSFSVQGAKARRAGGDPARADQIQLEELAGATPRYEAAARAAGLDPHNSLLLASYYDMQTQSPATARAFLERLPRLAQQGLTQEHITQARIDAFNNNGGRGGWHRPGHEARVNADAHRREAALVTALRAQGLAN